MAKTTQNDELFQRLRAQGLRKRTARLICEASDGRRKPDESVQQTLDNLKQIVSEAEDRLSERSATREAAARKAATTRRATVRSRSAAARKAANTRKTNARSRSAAAKKGARTRARASK